LGGWVECPTQLSDKAYKNFRDSWETSYSGVTNQHKVAVLESGLKYNPIGLKPIDSQALESRKFQILEICRMMGVPPHKVFDLDRATFSNIEQQNIEYVQESIAPMAVRLEQTIIKDLLTEREQEMYFPKFNVNGLLRGDLAARTTYYHNARQDGWMSANEIRELEDINRIPTDQGGDLYAINGNMMPLSSIPENKPKGARQNA
jgi:HK97 family phage portal protein